MGPKETPPPTLLNSAPITPEPPKLKALGVRDVTGGTRLVPSIKEKDLIGSASQKAHPVTISAQVNLVALYNHDSGWRNRSRIVKFSLLPRRPTKFESE